MHDPEVYMLDYVPPELRIEVGGRGVGWGSSLVGVPAGSDCPLRSAGAARQCLRGSVPPPHHRKVACKVPTASEMRRLALHRLAAAANSPHTNLLSPLHSLTLQVTRQFVVGFSNCMAAAGYLVSQGQLPKPRLLAQMLTIVPGLDKA